MKCAVIILNTNDSVMALRCVKQYKSFKSIDYIVVADNLSSDEGIGRLEEYCVQNGVDFILTNGNRGYNAGNNFGIRFAIKKYKPDILYVSNSDIVTNESAIIKINDCFVEKSGTGVCTGLIHNFDSNHNPHIFSAWGWKTPSYRDFCINCLPVTRRIIKKVFHKSIYYPTSVIEQYPKKYFKVEGVSGCFFAISREAYEKIGGFDEEVFLYNEEPILAKTLKDHKYPVYVRKDALVYHDEDPNKRSTLKKRIIAYKRNLQGAKVYLYKYLGVGRACFFLYAFLYTFGTLELKPFIFLISIYNKILNK